MTISIPALRELLENHYYEVERPVTLLALVELAVAARRDVETRDAYLLDDAAGDPDADSFAAWQEAHEAMRAVLARFDFGEET